MSDTKKENEKYKLDKPWKEIQSDKRKYIERLQQELEAKDQMINWKEYNKRNTNDGQ
jgi:hypothetical protein